MNLFANGDREVLPAENSTIVRRDLFVLTIIALAVRSLWTRRGVGVTPDGQYYLTVAKNLAFHHVFSNSENFAALAPTAHRPPFYPAVIAVFWWGDSAPLILVTLVQVVLGAVTVALVYRIALDRFSRTVALLAAGGMALAPMSSYYTSLILSETLFTFLVALGCFLWGRERAVATGIAFGLAALTRTTIVPFLFILLLLPLLPAWRRHWRSYVIIVVTSLAVSSVWIIRNAVTFGEFIPIAASGGGVNLLFGTIETQVTGSQIWTGTKWTHQQRDHPLATMDAHLPEKERNDAQTRRALRIIAADPLHWVAVRAKQYPKLFIDSGPYIFYPHNTPIEASTRLPQFLVAAIRLTFLSLNLLVLGLAVCGVFVMRAQFVSLSHITLFPIFLAAVHLPMWIEPRYSLPMVPLVAVLAAVGATWLPGKLKPKNALHKT
ncbi:MAG TPA: glycosyltransferase family 39 protein [Pyrinomonadaceae bacterium]|nr:glycosyltransferase family 39 protein [Pyrinomonadaceae bacterium]